MTRPAAPCVQDLLAMVPRPVLAVIMCYPITKEVDEAAQAGGRRRQQRGARWRARRQQKQQEQEQEQGAARIQQPQAPVAAPVSGCPVQLPAALAPAGRQPVFPTTPPPAPAPAPAAVLQRTSSRLLQARR